MRKREKSTQKKKGEYREKESARVVRMEGRGRLLNAPGLENELMS